VSTFVPIAVDEPEVEEQRDDPFDELDKEFVNDLIDKILVFCETLSGHKYYNYQRPFARRIVESVVIRDADEISGLAARQSGKTELIANTVAGLMILLPVLAKIYPKLLGVYAEGLWVGLFAPVEGQAETVYARVITRLTSDRAKEILSDPELNITLKRIPGTVRGSKLSNQSVVMMMTANPKAKIESKTFHLIVIDECQESDDVVVNKSISPMLAHYKGTMIKAGTPTYTKNNFYNTIQLNKRTQTRRGSRQNHFQWTWKEVAKEVPDYGDFIKKEILKLGEDSDEFNLSYCVAPATRILTADLRHIPASEVRVGQELVGFDEHVPGFHLHRKTKTATVEKVERLTLPSSRITLSDGTVVVASDDHLWLVRTSGSRTAWMKTSDLGSKRYATRGQLPRIIRVTDVWDEAPNTYEKGYLAAAFDGEGHLSCSKPGCATLAFSQKEGDMLQQVRDMVRDFGFSKSEHVQTSRRHCAGHQWRIQRYLSIPGNGSTAEAPK
jgi:hypothetical protein